MGTSKASGSSSIRDQQTGVTAKVENNSEGTPAVNVIAEVTNGDDDLAVSFSSLLQDIFGNLKTSQQVNLFEYEFRYDRATDVYWDTDATSGGTGSVNTNTVSYELNCTSTTGSQFILQSRRYIEYRPSETQSVFFTANYKGAVANIMKCVGLYDDENGVFLQLDGTTPKFVIRSKTSGSVVDTTASQSNWNGDKLDGTGASGVTVDWEDQQLFEISFGWLGSAPVELYFYNGAEKVLVHRFTNTNSIAVPYSQSGTLPVRAEIENLSSGAAESMHLTCVSVAARGTRLNIGRVRPVDYDVNSAREFENGTEKIAVGFRIKSTYKYSSAKPIEFSGVSNGGGAEFLWRLYFNPTLSGGGSWADVDGSILQRLTNAPSFSGGTVIASGYLGLKEGESSASNQRSVESDVFAGRNIGNTEQDIFILTIDTTDDDFDAFFGVNVREFL